MTGELAIELMAQMLLAGLLISAPLLFISMLVGLLISMLQVVTQIQEMSLTFVPKLVTVVVVMVAFGPWMLGRLTHYATDLIQRIPQWL